MATGIKPEKEKELWDLHQSGKTALELAEIFKALGDETRLTIVQLLVGKQLCVCDILDSFDMSQPAISHHLKILRQAGVVRDKREGKWIYYSLNPATLELLSCILCSLQLDADKKSRTGRCVQGCPQERADNHV
jgi:ArsR family transcriptional regulator